MDFDERVEITLRELIQIVLDKRALKEIKLLIKPLSKEGPTFWIGIHSAVTTAPGEFLFLYVTYPFSLCSASPQISKTIL